MIFSSFKWYDFETDSHPRIAHYVSLAATTTNYWYHLWCELRTPKDILKPIRDICKGVLSSFLF